MLEHAYLPSTWLPYLLIVVELVSVLAWPLVIFFAAHLFSEEIRQAFRRILRIGKDGIEFKGVPQQNNSFSFEDELESNRLTASQIKDSYFAEVRESIERETATIDQEQLVSVLKNALSSRMIERHFALVYAQIFTDQIRFLKLINSSESSIDYSVAEDFVDDLLKQNKFYEDWNLTKFIQYLENNKLLESRDDGIHLNQTGRNFLNFLNYFGLSDVRLI